MRIWYLLVLLPTVALAKTATWPQLYNDGVTAYHSNDFARAVGLVGSIFSSYQLCGGRFFAASFSNCSIQSAGFARKNRVLPSSAARSKRIRPRGNARLKRRLQI